MKQVKCYYISMHLNKKERKEVSLVYLVNEYKSLHIMHARLKFENFIYQEKYRKE